MRNKAPLALMEQAVMLVVFALAAALCLRAFAWADGLSRQQGARDRAMVQAQNAAETLKHLDGDFEAAAERYGGVWEDGVWTISYDENWRQTDGEGIYRLTAVPGDSGLEYLGCAGVEVLEGETRLVRLEVCWQEVGGDG